MHTTTKTVPYGKYSRGTVFIFNLTRMNQFFLTKTYTHAKARAKQKNIERIDKMSMISEQVQYLRSLAADQTPKALYEVFGALNEAADTIESLSAKLADMEQPAEDCGKELLTII